MNSSQPVAILAGTGELPVMVAEKLKSQDRPVFLYRFSRDEQVDFTGLVDSDTDIDPTRFSFVPEKLKQDGVKEVILVGDVDKKQIFDSQAHEKADPGVRNKLADLTAKGDDALIRLACKMLERRGLRVVGVDEILSEKLTPEGLIVGDPPDSDDMATVELLSALAIKLADEEVGQVVTGKQQAVIAVEGVEGTSELIRRSRELAGSDFVMLKIARSSQDYRHDVPVVGEETVRLLAEAGASLLALEANVTLFLQQEKSKELAREAGLTIIGWTRPPFYSWRGFKQWLIG